MAEEKNEDKQESKEVRDRITIRLTEDIATAMEQYDEVNWSEVARKAFASYIEERIIPFNDFIKQRIIQIIDRGHLLGVSISAVKDIIKQIINLF